MLTYSSTQLCKRWGYGPSEPACRSRLQTTSSCCSQKLWWWALRKSHGVRIVAGGDQGDEYKRTTDEVSKQ